MDNAGTEEEVEAVVATGTGHEVGAAKAVVASRAQVAFARKVRPRMLMIGIDCSVR